MAESYKKAKYITTTGATSGFIGFQNISASQPITISGPFIFGGTGPGASGGSLPITITVPAGTIVPVKCVSITPSTNPVLGFIE